MPVLARGDLVLCTEASREDADWMGSSASAASTSASVSMVLASSVLESSKLLHSFSGGLLRSLMPRLVFLGPSVFSPSAGKDSSDRASEWSLLPSPNPAFSMSAAPVAAICGVSGEGSAAFFWGR